eukprot:TRINITY_DN12452_c0_g1_i1.p1 TRINITY_DN12452_c0_g1~~TRINITY_DN12452_c0_g1_i1.p1  ORF type:complete len:465 (+),score=120.08 TRINITY_DN12452_c0_g1_i1:238-1632(+)
MGGTGSTMWEKQETSGATPEGVAGHCLEASGECLWKFGGWNGRECVERMMCYNVPGKKWGVVKADGTIPAPRAHTCFLRHGSHLYMFGGSNEAKGEYYNDMYRFDPVSLRWSKLDCIGEIPSPRHMFAARQMHGKMYLFGGSNRSQYFRDLYCFHFDENLWELLKPSNDSAKNIPAAVGGCRITCDPYTTRLYLHGGYNGEKWYSNLFRFDVETRRWDKLPRAGKVPKPRVGHAIAFYSNSVFVFGGFDGKKRHRKMYRYDLEDESWTVGGVSGAARSLPIALTSHTVTLWVDPSVREGPPRVMVFLFGGTIAQGVYSDVLFKLDVPARLENKALWLRIKDQTGAESPDLIRDSSYTPNVDDVDEANELLREENKRLRLKNAALERQVEDLQRKYNMVLADFAAIKRMVHSASSAELVGENAADAAAPESASSSRANPGAFLSSAAVLGQDQETAQPSSPSESS